jgi:hypothetical protein
VGDEVGPAPQRCSYPVLLLDFPAPDVLAYPREAVVAEKLEAMVVSAIATAASKISSIYIIWRATFI